MQTNRERQTGIDQKRLKHRDSSETDIPTKLENEKKKKNKKRKGGDKEMDKTRVRHEEK